ncbi:hypothetical protein CDO87_03520 [Sagittula sp. P11]|uniref:hypothetical protein n=1 Tax=Sagittula sp. P11 TaxID=2009329 RepID=UPI000C2CF59E|nr:hypothetical protein [Sagittula sp. P11]AUC52313.1 hypothetical protein CDO87_03520 [Sagittula sp. P11]
MKPLIRTAHEDASAALRYALTDITSADPKTRLLLLFTAMREELIAEGWRPCFGIVNGRFEMSVHVGDLAVPGRPESINLLTETGDVEVEANPAAVLATRTTP